MCERLMMGIEYKEFVRSVPISQIMTVEECRSICSNYNVDFYSLSMDEDVNENSAIMSLYPDGRYIDGIQNAGLVQGESRAGHHSLWVRAYYDKLVPPGVLEQLDQHTSSAQVNMAIGEILGSVPTEEMMHKVSMVDL
jgi:hypothetical protein